MASDYSTIDFDSLGRELETWWKGPMGQKTSGRLIMAKHGLDWDEDYPQIREILVALGFSMDLSGWNDGAIPSFINSLALKGNL